MDALAKLPRNSEPRSASTTAARSRVVPRGYIRLFGISRIQFREMGFEGADPGREEGKLVIFSDAGNPGIRKSVFLPGGESVAAGMRPAQKVRVRRPARRRRIPGNESGC